MVEDGDQADRARYSLKLDRRLRAVLEGTTCPRMALGLPAIGKLAPDGRVLVRASCEHAVEQARFVLALDDDTSEFHRRFARDPLLGRVRAHALRGLRPRAQGDRCARDVARRLRAADPVQPRASRSSER